jgi:purine-binding chemotaxis protein CheW
MEQQIAESITEEPLQSVEEKYILFALAGETYGVPILHAQEIIADFELTVLPYLPEFFDGVISLRGEAVPVINLRHRFNLSRTERDHSSRIIIVEMDPTPIGMLVDKVHKVFSIDTAEIEEPPDFTMDKKARFVNGVTEIEKKKFAILLDMQQILTSEEKIELSQTHDYLDSKYNDKLTEGSIEDFEATESETSADKHPRETPKKKKKLEKTAKE